MKRKTIMLMLVLSANLMGNDKVVSYNCNFPQYASEKGLKKANNFNLKFKIDKLTGKSYMEKQSIGRNTVMLGGIVPSQYYGMCTIK